MKGNQGKRTRKWSMAAVASMLVVMVGLLSNGANAEEELKVGPMVAGGTHGSYLAVKSDGTVWMWSSTQSQSDGFTVDGFFLPSKMEGVADVVDVAQGMDQSVALESDGSVWVWENNMLAPVDGEGSVHESNLRQVQEVSDVVDVAAGYYHMVAVKSDGTVWTWGDNAHGQLGDDTTESKSTPVQVEGIADVVAVAAGQSHTVALKSDGTMWGWGVNAHSQLGDGVQEMRLVPDKFEGISGVVDIAAGERHTVAVRYDETVWTCGSEELNEGSNDEDSTLKQVGGLEDVVAAEAGVDVTVGLKSDGTVWKWAWSKNDGGWKDGVDLTVPTMVEGLSDVTNIALGMALRGNGTVWSWRMGTDEEAAQLIGEDGVNYFNLGVNEMRGPARQITNRERALLGVERYKVVIIPAVIVLCLLLYYVWSRLRKRQKGERRPTPPYVPPRPLQPPQSFGAQNTSSLSPLRVGQPMERLPPSQLLRPITLVNRKTSERVVVRKSGFVIGASPRNADHCINSMYVSRKHAIITYENGKYYIQDCNSKNHTYVNRVPLTGVEKKELMQGMELGFAGEEYYISF